MSTDYAREEWKEALHGLKDKCKFMKKVVFFLNLPAQGFCVLSWKSFYLGLQPE